MDEVFGADNFAGQVVVQKTGGLGSSGLKSVADYLVWYAKDRAKLKYRPIFVRKELGLGDSTVAFEATIPTPVDWEDDGVEDSGAPEGARYNETTTTSLTSSCA